LETVPKLAGGTCGNCVEGKVKTLFTCGIRDYHGYEYAMPPLQGCNAVYLTLTFGRNVARINPSKHCYPATILHGVTFQNKAFFFFVHVNEEHRDVYYVTAEASTSKR